MVGGKGGALEEEEEEEGILCRSGRIRRRRGGRLRFRFSLRWSVDRQRRRQGTSKAKNRK